MPLRKVELVSGEFYHIVKRAIEERDIFLDREDHLRFMNSLLVFNDTQPCSWYSRGFWHTRKHIRTPGSLSGAGVTGYTPKKPLIEIHAFALMKNHFHLLIRQLVEGGTVMFMNKLGGYSRYFNKKYARVGPLFQDRYKMVRIEDENHLKNTFVYIHTNPAEIVEPEWKKWKVVHPKKVLRFLESEYPWSSYGDYLGRKNFPSLITRDFFLKLLNGEEGIRKEIESWISFKAFNKLEKFLRRSLE